MAGFLQEGGKAVVLILHIHCVLKQTKRVPATRKDLKKTAVEIAHMSSLGFTSCISTVNIAESSARFNIAVGI